MRLLADTSLEPIGGAGLGPFGTQNLFGTDSTVAVQKITGVISAVVGFLTITASIWFLFQLLFGGYEWISSAGDTKKLTTARQRIMNGFFGLIIVVAAYAIVAVVGQFLGYDILNPATTIQKIQF